MQPTELKTKFNTIKKSVKTAKPADVLKGIGAFVKEILGLLEATCDHVPITWKGKGAKAYKVFVAKGTKIPFSRAANVDLFINDPAQFETQWKAILASLETCSKAKTGKLVHDAASLDRAFYTVVIAFAAAIDLHYPGDRGSPGALFEIAVGSAISYLTGIDQKGQVALPIPIEEVPEDAKLLVKSDGDEEEVADSEDGEEHDPGADPPIEEEEEELAVVKADRWFQGAGNDLIVALKISTRERISQVSVQQLILERIKPGGFKSILCACNENNVMAPKGTKKDTRTYDTCWLVDTLVPKTIALYHRFVAPFAGMYYLDPPEPYFKRLYPGLPPIKRFRDLLTDDLPMLLGGWSPKSDR